MLWFGRFVIEEKTWYSEYAFANNIINYFIDLRLPFTINCDFSSRSISKTRRQSVDHRRRETRSTPMSKKAPQTFSPPPQCCRLRSCSDRGNNRDYAGEKKRHAYGNASSKTR